MGIYRNSTANPGSLYRRTGRPPDPPPHAMALRQRYRVWVEGERVLEIFETADRLEMDRIEPVLKKLGFLVHRQAIGDDDQSPKRRRLTVNRVTMPELRAFLAGRMKQGATLAETTEFLYKTEPWTDLARDLATHKARQALNRLCNRGQATRFHEPSGPWRYFHKNDEVPHD